MPVIEPKNAVKEGMAVGREVDWRFGASLRPQLALWLGLIWLGPFIPVVHKTYEDGTGRVFRNVDT